MQNLEESLWEREWSLKNRDSLAIGNIDEGVYTMLSGNYRHIFIIGRTDFFLAELFLQHLCNKGGRPSLRVPEFNLPQKMSFGKRHSETRGIRPSERHISR